MKNIIQYKGKYIRVETKNYEGVVLEKAFFLPSVHIFPVRADGKILFISEKRWENDQKLKLLIPSGVMDEPGESPEQAALRELEEEIGYITKKPLELFYKWEEKGTINDERYYFIARDVEPTHLSQLESQIVDLIPMDINEIFEAVCEGKFGMSRSALAYLRLHNAVKNGEISL